MENYNELEQLLSDVAHAPTATERAGALELIIDFLWQALPSEC